MTSLVEKFKALPGWQKLLILTLTPGLPPPGPFGKEKETPMFNWLRNRFGARENPRLKAAEGAQLAAGVKRGAAYLVIRAREGDQNAMGILFMLGKQAQEGNRKAARAVQEIQRYIKVHPNRPSFGAEAAQDGPLLVKLNRFTQTDDDNQYCQAVVRIVPLCSERVVTVLSHGPDVFHDEQRLKALSCSFGGEDETGAFGYGLIGEEIDPQTEGQAKAWHVGRCVGLARKIQAVRIGAPLAVLNPRVAWELG
jgi:hypothetical protein